MIAFFGEHTFLAFCAGLGVYFLGEVFFRLCNRVIRHLNIRKHGWPPPHCDADGDLIQAIQKENGE